MFNALADFLIYCRVERRLAELTCKAYERDVRACLEFLCDHGIAALAEIRTPDLRRFLAEEATHRPAPSSQARTVAALRCFFRFCVEGDYSERDPAHVLRTPKKREALPDVLDRKELSRLLDVPAREGVWTRLHAGKLERDRLLLALFAYGGLRRSELLGLDWDDVDLERRLIRVRKAKAGVSASCRFTPASCHFSSPTKRRAHRSKTPRRSWAYLAIASPPRSSRTRFAATLTRPASPSASALRPTRYATYSPRSF